LLKPAKLRLEFGCDDEPRSAIEQPRVDDAAARCLDRDLETGRPPRRKASEELFDHRRLEAVDKTRPRAGEVAKAEVRSEGNPDRDERLDARRRLSAFDPTQVRTVQARHGGQFGQGDPGVQSKPLDLLADGQPQLPHSLYRSVSHRRRCHGHGR
jgi:hypothetical protein